MFNLGAQKVATKLPNQVILTSGDRSEKKLYLSFDDGPQPEITARLMELLDSYEIKASFFCVGKLLEEYSAIAKTLLENGHLLGNHSYYHRGFARKRLEAQLAEIRACSDLIRDLGSRDVVPFRAPQGIISPRLLLALLRQGIRVVHWSYDSLDYKKNDFEQAVPLFVQKPVRSGDIILFHDDAELSYQMLAYLIPQWLDQGYQFGDMKELFR